MAEVSWRNKRTGLWRRLGVGWRPEWKWVGFDWPVAGIVRRWRLRLGPFGFYLMWMPDITPEQGMEIAGRINRERLTKELGGANG